MNSDRKKELRELHKSRPDFLSDSSMRAYQGLAEALEYIDYLEYRLKIPMHKINCRYMAGKADSCTCWK